MIEQNLRQLGLNDNEIKMYLANLQLGTARIQKIAKKSGILRTTAYEVVKSLVNKGLASTVIKSGVMYVDSADPHKLEEILKERLNAVKEILPQLDALKNTILEKPSVELYEGKEGLKTIFEDIIITKKEMWGYANYKIFEVLEFYFPQFVHRRIKNKIRARIIQQKVKQLIRVNETNEKEYREMRFSNVIFKSNVFIYGDNIALITVKENELIGVVIRNKDIADTQRQVFELLWESSE